MELIRQFSALSRHDTPLAGGKGASLGEMTQAGIPVPPGFVLLASAFERFMDETDLSSEVDAILHTVNKEQVHTVEHASEKIQGLILAASMPEDIKEETLKNFKALGAAYVAVRSSATAEDSASAAWAGQLDSFLNTTEETLLQNMKRCWASLFTPRAIFYRFEKELHTQKISVAVVVQKMVESECSGIAFSVHPITEDHNQLIIEAGYGLGEAIVSGQITPDSYVVEKNPRRIIDANASTQVRGLYRKENGGNEWRDIKEPQASSQVLSEAQILELSEIIVTIENHYGFPSDIEWALEKGRFYIVQSRPITTLSNASNAWNQTIDAPEEKLNPKEYSYYYGGGALFLPLDLISRYYGARGLRAEFITFIENNKSTTFLSNATLERLHKEGLAYTLEEVKQKAEELQRLMEACEQKTSKLQEVSVIDEAKCKEVFSDIGAILELYSIFDFKLWDGVFASSQDERGKREIVKYVQNHKNVVRASLGTILFEKEGYLLTLLKKLSEMRAMHLDDLLNCSMEDVLSIVNGRDVSESIGNNKNLSCFVFQQGEYHTYHKDVALALWQQFNIPGKEKTLFQGKVANIGKPKVRGTVFLIKNYTSVAEVIKYIEKEMNRGDVLVSETTNPDIITAFKKASAVITDTGGLLSHAAITSRELGITCVIDTEDASKHLHNGDLVEVDAEKGIVRILKDDNTNKISLSKYMTREHSMVYAHVWNTANTNHWDQYFLGPNIKNMVFFLNQRGVLEVYYDLEELDSVLKGIGDGVAAKPEIADRIITDFYERWQRLLPYATGAKKIETLEEFKEYYQNWIQWWYAMEHVFVIPDQPQVPKEVRDKIFKVRAESQEYSDADDQVFINFITEKYPQFADIAKVLLPDEVEMIETLSADKIANIRERLEGCALTTFNGVSSFSLVKNLPEKLMSHGFALHSPEVTRDAREVRGTPASPGLATGKVRLVLRKADLELVEKGEVMVTYATSPDYVPTMKKCAAIVTDEGGIVNHAAIVSRELGLPCVVGTNIGTEFLKNGDMVEVDADRGVVIILN